MYPVEVNYLAALAAACLAFVLGALWYGPLFGRAWTDAQGMTEEELKEASGGMGKTYTATFISYAFMAIVLAIFIYLLNPPDVWRGLWVGSMVWFGFMVPVNLTSVLFSRRKSSLFYIDGAYQLVSVLIMALVLTAWR